MEILNKNQKKENLLNGNGGRKIGSKNKLTQEAREILFESLKHDLNNLERLLNGLHPDEKMINLKAFAKILASGNDKISNEVREILFSQLKPHFKKINLYFSHVEQKNKVSELRQFLKLLNPDNIEEIITDIKVNQRIKLS